MKRIRPLVLVLGFLLLAPASAPAAGQEVRGTVIVPVSGRVGDIIVDSCPGVLGVTISFATGTPIFHRFSVSPTTWGQAFALEADAPAGLAGLDIAFLSSSGTWTQFDAPGLGGEMGIVPTDADQAFICLNVGTPTGFVYRAG